MIEANDPTEYVKADEDKAALLQESLNQQGIANVAARNAPETHPDFDGKHCIDCDDLMPTERLAMGRIRCVYCQHTKEVNEKRYGKS